MQQMPFRHDFIHQAQTPRLARGNRAAGEHHVERRQVTHQRRQAHAAGKSGMNPQAHLGQSQARGSVLARQAISAGQRQFQAAAETKTVDHGHRRKRQAREPRADLLAELREFGGAHRVGDSFEFAHIGPGDEPGGLAGADDQSLERLVLQFSQMPVQFQQHFLRQHVGRLAGDIERQQRVIGVIIEMPVFAHRLST